MVHYNNQDLDFLKTGPLLVPPRESATYVDKIIRDTCPTMLTAGLLTQEIKCWNDFPSIAGEFLQILSNVSLFLKQPSFLNKHIPLQGCRCLYINIHVYKSIYMFSGKIHFV